MKRSLNEVGLIVQKAAMGAGIPVGQAEDLSRVALFIARANGDLSCVAKALEELHAALDVEFDGDLIVIKAGMAALAGPVVRDAFVMGATRAALADATHTPLVTAMLQASGFAVGAKAAQLDRMGSILPAHGKGPVEVPDDIWIIWEKLAARTYVPASETSRLAGAGAGEIDND